MELVECVLDGMHVRWRKRRLDGRKLGQEENKKGWVSAFKQTTKKNTQGRKTSKKREKPEKKKLQRGFQFKKKKKLERAWESLRNKGSSLRGAPNKRIRARIDGELLYLNGSWFQSSTTMNKPVSQSLQNETHVYTEKNARFIHRHGVAYRFWG